MRTNLMMAFLTAIAAVLAAMPGRTAEPDLLDGVKRDYAVKWVEPESPGEESRRVYTVTGFTFWAEKTDRGGKPAAVFRREERTKEGYKVYYEVVSDLAGGHLISSERKTVTSAGELVSQNLDFYTAVNKGQRNPNQAVMHFIMFPVCFQNVTLAPDQTTKVKFAFSAENVPWSLIFETEGEERIAVPAGTFDCVKIKMTFDTSELTGSKSMFAKIFATIFPSYYAWVEKAPPHTMIKMQGKFGGFTSPDQIHELVKVHREAAAEGPAIKEPGK